MASGARYLDALVRAPRALLDEGRLIHFSDAHVGSLAAGGGMWSIDDFPFAGLVEKPVADLQLHREKPLRAGRRGFACAGQRRLRPAVLLALLLRTRLRHRPESLARNLASRSRSVLYPLVTRRPGDRVEAAFGREGQDRLALGLGDHRGSLSPRRLVADLPAFKKISADRQGSTVSAAWGATGRKGA